MDNPQPSPKAFLKAMDAVQRLNGDGCQSLREWCLRYSLTHLKECLGKKGLSIILEPKRHHEVAGGIALKVAKCLVI